MKLCLDQWVFQGSIRKWGWYRSRMGLYLPLFLGAQSDVREWSTGFPSSSYATSGIWCKGTTTFLVTSLYHQAISEPLESGFLGDSRLGSIDLEEVKTIAAFCTESLEISTFAWFFDILELTNVHSAQEDEEVVGRPKSNLRCYPQVLRSGGLRFGTLLVS